ncbi:MAG TPA: TadE/TadG family type IV pilus assembly protein [Planctomycetaceae bacterium]|jgi:Flp pilus assembly protein TadG
MLSIRRNPQIPQSSNQECRRGVAAVETALLLPVFIAAVLGLVELGRGIMISQLLETAARNGARLAIIDGTTNAQVTSNVQTFLLTTANIAPGNITVAIADNGSGSAPLANATTGDTISVTVSVPFSTVSWLPPNYLKGVTLSALCVMQHE